MPTSKRRKCTRERIRGGSLKSLRRCYRRSCGRHVSRLPTNSSPHRRLPLYAEPKLANSALKREAEQTTPHKNLQRINAVMLCTALPRFGEKGQDRLVTLLPFVLRVVSFPRSPRVPKQRVHRGVGIQGDRLQPHVRRFPHPLPHPPLHF